MKIYTLGHGGRTLDQLAHMLAEQGIGALVDIRGPGCLPRRNPTALERALRQTGIHYVREGRSLGGPHPEASDDLRHGALASSFRGFAAHMASPEFRAGIDRLLDHAATCRTALFCAEPDPADCHRSLIADYLTVRGYEVRHLIAPGEHRRHVLHPAAWLEGRGLRYHRPLETPAPVAGG